MKGIYNGSTTASLSSSSIDNGSKKSSTSRRSTSNLPALFWYIEMNEWGKAIERARRHPREVRTWATIRTKSSAVGESVDDDSVSVSGAKRLPLHHACFKLRNTQSTRKQCAAEWGTIDEDPFLESCRLILTLVSLYPEAAGMRESRHGCLPLHLAAFAACPARSRDSSRLDGGEAQSPRTTTQPKRIFSMDDPGTMHGKPPIVQKRSSSLSSTDNSSIDGLSQGLVEELRLGELEQVLRQENGTRGNDNLRTRKTFSSIQSSESMDPAPRKLCPFSATKRDDMAVQVLNALLDAYPKGIRVDSEGGRLPLHTACAGRASPRVISTILTAYPAAARHRNKDGFLPVHLCAHWGVAHPDVAVSLLKAYPDATLGRNRWERTPLEEALCMAGENGRPHQAELVRYLRKHPSYWAKDLQNILSNPSPRASREKTTAVDIDETIADSTSTESFRRPTKEPMNDPVEDPPQPPQTSLMSRLTPRNMRRKSPNSASSNIKRPALYSVSSNDYPDLSSLIRNFKWHEVVSRCEASPGEASVDLFAMSRGGHMAQMTPLHFACERDPPIEVIEALIEAHRDAAGSRMNPGGQLPLHIACTWKASADVVGFLLAAKPKSAKYQDDLRNLPLHCAVFSGAAPDIIESLLCTYPKSAMIRNMQGSLAEDIVRRLRHESRKEVLQLLESRREAIMFRRHSSGDMGNIATQAIEKNRKEGLDPFNLVRKVSSKPVSRSTGYSRPRNHTRQHNPVVFPGGGIEVAIDDGAEEPMLWI